MHANHRWNETCREHFNSAHKWQGFGEAAHHSRQIKAVTGTQLQPAAAWGHTENSEAGVGTWSSRCRLPLSRDYLKCRNAIGLHNMFKFYPFFVSPELAV